MFSEKPSQKLPLTADLASHLGTNHLKHDKLASTCLVAKGNDGSLVTGHGHMEDVHTSVEAADLRAGLQAPQADGAVTRARHHNLVVRGDCTAPDLRQKEMANVEECIRTFQHIVG